MPIPSELADFRIKPWDQSLGADRCSVAEGAWGYLPSFWCDSCKSGTDHEPQIVCTARGSRLEPSEYEWVCPNCSSYDINEITSKDWPPFKATHRYTIHKENV